MLTEFELSKFQSILNYIVSWKKCWFRLLKILNMDFLAGESKQASLAFLGSILKSLLFLLFFYFIYLKRLFIGNGMCEPFDSDRNELWVFVNYFILMYFTNLLDSESQKQAKVGNRLIRKESFCRRTKKISWFLRTSNLKYICAYTL